MKKCLTGFFVIVCIALHAQKPVIDTSVFDKWPGAGGPVFSADSRYLAYTINNQPLNDHTLVLQSASGNWKQEIVGAEYNQDLMGADGQRAVFKMSNNRLCILKLGTAAQEIIGGVQSFEFGGTGKKELLIYMVKEPGKEEQLLLRPLTEGSKAVRINSVKVYYSNRNFRSKEPATALVLQKLEFISGKEVQCLYWYDIATAISKKIYEGAKIRGCRFDGSGNQLAIMTQDSLNHRLANKILYYQKGRQQAEELVSNSSPGIEEGLELSAAMPQFNKDGNRIFFRVAESSVGKPAPTGVQVDVWSYSDAIIQGNQMRHHYDANEWLYVVNTGNRQAVRLQKKNEVMSLWENLSNRTDYIVMDEVQNRVELFWHEKLWSSAWLVSLKDGSRKLLRNKLNYLSTGTKEDGFLLTPSEKFVIHYDPYEDDYLSYEISTGTWRNITLDVPAGWAEYTADDGPGGDPATRTPYGIAAWEKGDTTILLQTKFDIWRVDLLGRGEPVNLTNGYGRSHHIQFRFVNYFATMGIPINGRLSFKGRMILSGFDTASKHSGFYSMSLGKAGDPVALLTGPFKYSQLGRSMDGKAFVFCRETASEAPDFYRTTDFKELTAITDIQPQKAFNWLTAELVNWTLPDGKLSQGILYKPEDFNPNRRYPIIFYYYEKLSDGLYQFERPGASHGTMNIPWFVSRGYLVFKPDIHYEKGLTGEGALEAVESAAKYLLKQSWVDPARMGLQGHSHGGFETNYIITHSHLFAAAAEGSGVSDIISAYFNVDGGFGPMYYEYSQGRIYASLWERPDLYLKNSPVFRAHHVQTPLLMMNNKKDEVVPFTQGLELFTALRRLGKPAWLLQYDQGGHSINDPGATLDYTIRLEQFFNHYLKGALPPKWMTEGVPLSRKGIDTGYDLDLSGKVPEEQPVLFEGKMQKVSEALKNKPKKVYQLSF